MGITPGAVAPTDPTISDPIPAPTPIPESTPTPAPTGNCGPYPDITVTGGTSGTVWGSNPYTDDSNMGKAVVHSGLAKVGETVTIIRTNVGFLSNFVGSTANGVTTTPWTRGWCGFTIALKVQAPPPTPEPVPIPPPAPTPVPIGQDVRVAVRPFSDGSSEIMVNNQVVCRVLTNGDVIK